MTLDASRTGVKSNVREGKWCCEIVIGMLTAGTTELRAIETTNAITATARWRPRSSRTARQARRSDSRAGSERATQIVIAFAHQIDTTIATGISTKIAIATPTHPMI